VPVPARGADPVADGPPAAAGLLLIIILPAPKGEKSSDQDHEDHGDDADQKQSHRTTQQSHGRMGGASEAHAAMARAFPCIASALKPSKAELHDPLVWRTGMNPVMRLGIFLPNPFTHRDSPITGWL
jgi:hypothetical protein